MSSSAKSVSPAGTTADVAPYSEMSDCACSGGAGASSSCRRRRRCFSRGAGLEAAALGVLGWRRSGSRSVASARRRAPRAEGRRHLRQRRVGARQFRARARARVRVLRHRSVSAAWERGEQGAFCGRRRTKSSRSSLAIRRLRHSPPLARTAPKCPPKHLRGQNRRQLHLLQQLHGREMLRGDGPPVGSPTVASTPKAAKRCSHGSIRRATSGSYSTSPCHDAVARLRSDGRRARCRGCRRWQRRTRTPLASAFSGAAAAACSDRSLATTLDAPASAARDSDHAAAEPTSTMRRPAKRRGWRRNMARQRVAAGPQRRTTAPSPRRRAGRRVSRAGAARIPPRSSIDTSVVMAATSWRAAAAAAAREIRRIRRIVR